MKILFKNANILMYNYDFIKADMLIEGGIIKEIGDIFIGQDIDKVIDATDKVIIPGLVNAHSHSYTGLLKGSVNNVPLDIYMLGAIAGGSFRSNEEIYLSTVIDTLQMLKSGTTSVIDHFSERPRVSMDGIDSAVKAFVDSGMRATIAPMFADKSYFETVPMEEGEFPQELIAKSNDKPQTPEEYIEVCDEAINKYHNYKDRIRITIGTDGPQRCSDRLLRLTADIENKYKVGWHSHILEAKTQAVMGHRLHGKGLVEKLDDLGLINERTGLVHFVWASDKEAQIVIDRKANLIHCPSSNLFLGSGLPNISRYLKEGMNIAIGSDGGNCGNLNMFEKIRLASLIHRINNQDYDDWITAERALKMALEGGSRAMLLEDKIGSLGEGKKADFLILNTRNATLEPINDLLKQLVYYENGSSIESVYVEGIEVIHNGKSTLIDEDEIISRAKIATERIKKDNKKAFELAAKQEPYFREMYYKIANEKII